MKTYILQKDLPDIKVGAEFSKNPNELYYSPKIEQGFSDYKIPFHVVETKIEWFKLKEEINPKANKTAILLKDLPDAPAGSIFSLGKDLNAYYLTSDKTGTRYNCYSYPKGFVETHTDWFMIKRQSVLPVEITRKYTILSGLILSLDYLRLEDKNDLLIKCDNLITSFIEHLKLHSLH